MKAGMHEDAVSHFFSGIQLGTKSNFNNDTKYYISAKFHVCMTNHTILPNFCQFAALLNHWLGLYCWISIVIYF